MCSHPNTRARGRFTIDVKGKWQGSCKVDALLKEIKELPTGCKCVIFSQFTAFLELLQVPLEECGLRYVRLDGSLSHEKREKVLHTFNTDTRVCAILLSLKVGSSLDSHVKHSTSLFLSKAGGVGLNLVAANYVYMMDPWLSSHSLQLPCVSLLELDTGGILLSRCRHSIVCIESGKKSQCS